MKQQPSVTGPQSQPGARKRPAAPPEHRWLMLTHHLPPHPSYLRVKVRRQLHRIGAVALKNSVYVLPPGEEAREDFEWLAREVERSGGESTLCLASFLDDGTDARIVTAFREARAEDYRAIASLAGEIRLKGDEASPAGSHTIRARGRKLRRRLESVKAIDFFDAPGQEVAERAVSRVESSGREVGEARPQEDGTPLLPRKRVWVTRSGVKVDRMASAWLIRRFIDPEATFKFVPARGYKPRAGELRFDMFDGEFTHEGDRCTFETLVEKFALRDPALTPLAEIVHDIDFKDEKFGRSQTGGVAALIDGITRVCEEDEERLRQGGALFDGLYEHFRFA